GPPQRRTVYYQVPQDFHARRNERRSTHRPCALQRHRGPLGIRGNPAHVAALMSGAFPSPRMSTAIPGVILMINPFTPFLEKHHVVVLDGALATELERRGADLRDPLWSAKLLLENPELIRQVQHDYYVAGADVATTASYQATLQGLRQRGFDHEQ